MEQYLHYLPVPVINSSECNSTKHYNSKMGSDKICAGYLEPEKTPCYLRGLLSHHNCGSQRHPAIYTVVDKNMRLWISNTIGSQAFLKAD
nr:unnamed protein product [Callosobruchus analis]